MRTYVSSHPWLTFRFDVDRVPANLWVLLGEARSKCDHIAGVPLRPTTAKMLHQLFLAKGVLGTTAIEGNTLTEQQVLDLLEKRLQLPPSQEYLATEIDNILTACNELLLDIESSKDPPELTPELISKFNRQILKGLSLEPGVVPGEIRTYPVIVSNYRGAPAEDCAYLLGRVCDWLNGMAPTGADADAAIVYAIIKAVLAHLYLAWIHPFGDGNGRVARLVEYLILVSAGIPSPAAHLLSNHYNLTRAEYYRQLAQAHQTGGEVFPFLIYAIQGFVDGLKDQLSLVREQQWDVAWMNYVHQAFRELTSPSDLRRRRLVLDLGRQREPVPRAKLREITPKIAAEYANKTDKTLSRDLNALARMGLVRPHQGGWVARREVILAFLPPRRSLNEHGHGRPQADSERRTA